MLQIRSIATKDFYDISTGIEWIKDNIRNLSKTKFKKGKYHFYFTVNKDEKTIVANEIDDKSEFTVCTNKKLNMKDEGFVRKVAQIHDLEYVSFVDYLVMNEDKCSEDETNALRKEYNNRYVLPITNKFELSDFEENDLFSEEFEKVCDDIYWQMVIAIERKYDNMFWKRLTLKYL